MAGDKDEAQQIVTDIIIRGGLEIGCGHLLLGLPFACELFMPALEPLIATEMVDGAPFCGRHQPGARILRNPCFRPLFEGCEEGLLGKILS